MEYNKNNEDFQSVSGRRRRKIPISKQDKLTKIKQDKAKGRPKKISQKPIKRGKKSIPSIKVKSKTKTKAIPTITKLPTNGRIKTDVKISRDIDLEPTPESPSQPPSEPPSEPPSQPPSEPPSQPPSEPPSQPTSDQETETEPAPVQAPVQTPVQAPEPTVDADEPPNTTEDPSDTQLEKFDEKLITFFDINVTQNPDIENAIVDIYNDSIKSDDKGFDWFYSNLLNNRYLKGISKDDVSILYNELETYPNHFPNNTYKAILMRIAAYNLISDINLTVAENSAFYYSLPSFTIKITKTNKEWIFIRIKNLNTGYIITKYSTTSESTQNTESQTNENTENSDDSS